MRKSLFRFLWRSASESVLEQERPGIIPPQGSGKGLWRAFRSLRQRNFRLFWSGQVISLMGSGIQTVGQAWLVLELTHSAWQLGLVGALQALPILLFSIFGGVFADRWPKRRVLLVTQSVALLEALFLWILIVSGTLQLWHLYVLVLLLGIMNSIGRPASRAFLMEMVGREELPNAVALNSALSSLARIVGPGIGGIIIALSGVSLLFLLNALSFLAVIAALALIRNRELYARTLQANNEGEHRSTWQSLYDGVNYIWKTPVVMMLILVVGLVLLFGSNLNVVLPFFATDILHGGARGFGFLAAALDIGALTSGLWRAWRNHQSTIRRILIGMFAFAIIEMLFAASHIYLLSLLLIASIGFMEENFALQALTMLQTVTPEYLHGRVISVQVLFYDGSLPLGYMLIGALSSLFGPSLALLIGAILTLMVAGGGWIWWKVAGIKEF